LGLVMREFMFVKKIVSFFGKRRQMMTFAHYVEHQGGKTNLIKPC